MELTALDIGSGPAALLLHGQPGSSADWSRVVVELRRRMRVIVPDRPGYGRSGGEARGFLGNATAAVELLDRLGVETAVVAGHSWGTGVALAMASRFPGRVRALVLVGTVAPGVRPGLVDRALAHRPLGVPATRLGFLAAGVGLSLPPMRRLARAAVPGLEPERLEATASEWRREDIWRSFYIEQRALVEELPTLAPDLASLQTPATILCGRHDRISPPPLARALARELPNARLIDVDGAGHLLPQQRPQLVAEAIAAAAAG